MAGSFLFPCVTVLGRPKLHHSSFRRSSDKGFARMLQILGGIFVWMAKGDVGQGDNVGMAGGVKMLPVFTFFCG